MAENKKRWLAIIMAMIMLIALLPDSFLSAVGVQAENISESDKNIETTDNSKKESMNHVEKEAADNTSEKRTITRKFSGETALKDEIFSFILYDENNEILLQLDNLGKEDKTAFSDESGIEISTQTDDIYLTVTLKNLDANGNYAYKFESSGNTNYSPVTEKIDLEKTSLEIQLAVRVEAELPHITLYVSQTQIESMDIIYKIYNATDNQIRGDVLAEGKIEGISSSVKKVSIKDEAGFFGESYGIEFYNIDNKLLSIQYVDSSNGHVLGAENNPIDVTKDTEPLELKISYENLGNTYTDVNDIKKKYYQGRKAIVEVNKNSDRIDIKALREKITNSIAITTVNNSENNTGTQLILTLSEKSEDGVYLVTDENANIVLKISEWNETTHSYNIEFVQSGEYLWKDMEYTDKSGNMASVSFSKIEGNTEEDKAFFIDNIGPTAECFIHIFPDIDSQNRIKINGGLFEVQKNYILRNTSLQLATNLSNADKSEFCLENVLDDYSGISKVDYSIFEEKKDYQSLVYWTNWTDGMSDIYNNTKLCISKDTDGIYYMYYRLEDNIGNVSYYDGLGFKLDVTPPEITLSYSIDNIEYKPISGSSITLKDNTKIKAVITEANLTDDNIVLEINKTKVENGVTISEGNNNTKELFFELTAENDQDQNYDIVLTCKDDVGHSSTVTAQVRIDKEPPAIDYIFSSKCEWKNEKESFFNQSVEVILSIEDVRFNKDNSTVTIKKNNEQEVLLSTTNTYGTNVWEADGDNQNGYKTILNFTAGDSTDDRYTIKTVYTDDAGNSVEHEESIIIDTNPPIVSINFIDANIPVSANGKDYYKKRTAQISVEEVSSLDMDNFKEKILSGISVKDKDNKEVEIKDKNQFYTVQKTADSDNSYTVEFKGDGNYELNISYTDKCGNETKQSAIAAFSIDNTMPEAKGRTELYKYNGAQKLENYVLSQTDRGKFSYLSTYFKMIGNDGIAVSYLSKFILTDIQDNLSGIKNIKYYLANAPLDQKERLEDIEDWTDKDAIFNNMEFTVTLPEKEETAAYYIYYRLEDYAGNIAYYNGAGILMDQENPEIKEFVYQNGGIYTIDEPEIIDNKKINVYTFSDNVQIDFEIQEANFDKDNTKIKIEKYNFEKDKYTDISDTIEKCTWKTLENISSTSLSTNIDSLKTKDGEVNQYKITVNTEDKVGRTNERTEIIRIDKEAAKINVLYQDDLTETAALHYYKKERIAKIKIEKTIYSFVSPKEFRKAIIDGISAKNEKDENIINVQNITAEITENYQIKTENTLIYEISAWNPDEKSYTVTFSTDAIYAIDIKYKDKAGNEGDINNPKEDGDSFVIDRQAPEIKVIYDNANMVYYKEKREANILVTDLSFTYTCIYEDNLTKLENGIVFNIGKQNPFMNTAMPEASQWRFDKNAGVFQKNICYKDNAIYTFGITDGTDICGNSLSPENISYTNTAGEKVNDATSFVIDSKAPVITVTYDDTNKKVSDFLNGYYRGERKATVSIQDLSLYYTKAVRKEEPLIDKSMIAWNIKVENEKNEELENNPDNPFYEEDESWKFDEKDFLFKCNILYKKDGIYTFDIISAQDICGIKSEDKDITYEVEDGQFFVIDTAAPIVTVTYDDTNKKENYYYKNKRTATVTLTDMSLTYAEKEGKNKEEDVLTSKKKINWIVTAKDTKGKDVDNVYTTLDKWQYDENTGSYTQIITFSGEAIYKFTLSGSDLCENKIDNIDYKAEDANSFVIDKTAPQIQIIYHDSAANKQTDGYYKDTRTAEIIVEDLSYVYEDTFSTTGKLTPENRISDWIKITAENAKRESVFNAFTNEDWSFDSSLGVYKKILRFEEDAIYSFSILDNGKIPADIYGKNAEIVYKNNFDNKETEVNDYASFVISRKAPDVKVIYDDNAENKQENHYYKAARTAIINVSDLSFVYEDSQKESADTSLAADKILIQITAENEKGDSVKNSYQMEGWTFEKENGIYTQKITYTEDAIYSWNISGKNIYGQEIQTDYQNEQNQKVEDYASFVIDRAAPKITIIYDNKNKISDYYENYFYQGERTAKIEVSDLSYVYEDQQKTVQAKDTPVLVTDNRTEIKITAVNESGELVENAFTKDGWSFKNGIYMNDITFTEDAIYKYENSATDIYNRTAEFTYISTDSLSEENIKDWASFVIDTTAPKVTVTYNDQNKGTNTTKQEYTNGYYKDNRTANITVSDLSFIYADKYMPEKADAENLVLNETSDDTNSYILPVINVYNNDTELEIQNAHTMNLTSLWSWNEAQNGYQASITFMAEAEYSFEIEGEDICKNKSGTNDISYSNTADANHFVIDKTAPTISITYDNNAPTRTMDGRGYFALTRTATVVITEGCDTFDREDAFNNITITAKDAAGNDVGADTYTISSWTESKASENGAATRYTATITYRGNANYTFAISYMDKTGHTAVNINTNNSQAPYTFTVDSVAPTGNVNISGFGSWNRLTELLTFDRWSNSTVHITASADDSISSVYSIKYYKTASVTAMTRQQLLDLNDSLWTDYREFSVRPDEMFSVYLRIEDRSGNISFVNSDGIIVDATAPNEESIAPEITVAPAQPVNNIYNTDVTVDITVADPIVNGSYSGLKSIRYEVQNMGAVTQQGQLYTFNYTAGQTLQSQLLQRWSGQIVVDRNLNNSNDVRIVVYAQDNSNNTSSAYTSIQIDVTQPSIDISYDNNNGDASFGASTYFNADRTAIIRITERNFNSNDVQITITNTDNVIPSISNWSSSAGTGNGDDTVHTATITYSADGDYVFAISYADLAGNINTTPDYGNSAAPEQFTIDKTLPVINVTYDNNSVQNDNYYSAARTATVSITEHNFDAGRYNITLTAVDDGADKSAPSISGWSNNGDIHTASVQFTDDGYYTMNMSYTDMAGNQAAQFTQQTFYVDQTMPRITVKGIQNNTANNAETIGFEITCTDTNFDVFIPQLAVTKMVNGSNVTENCEMNQMTPIKNGQVYTVDNLEQDGIYSLTCTARDKAGNVFNRVVYLNEENQEEGGIDALEGISFLNFSVNRSGSVYTLDAYTNEVAKEYYIREVDDDLVIVETNVDALNGYIELNGKKLVEGTDYRVEISGGNGEWYVVRYIINKELFAGEGEYKLLIYSEDNAGNVAYSDVKGTNMSFVIDKTAPIVTVAGIENNGRYQVERQTVTVIPRDDGGKLQKIMIEAFDENGDMLEGFPIVYEGEELLTLLEENNGELSFELPEGTGMSVRITCEDTAGNEMDIMSFDNIVVSTSRLTIILANKTLIYGVIAGILVLVVMIILLLVWKKHKKSKENNTEGQV